MSIRLLAVAATLAAAGLRAAPPNFVFILSDDQDWAGLSVRMEPDVPGSANPYVETPHLARLAAQGMVFSAAYAPAPACSPTRASLQTGKSPARLHWTKAAPPVEGRKLIEAAQIRDLPATETTIAELLKTAGYATAHLGKWHLGGGGPERHGYDVSDGDTGNQDAAPFTAPNPVDIFGMTTRAGAFLAKQARSRRPFFIQLSYHALHYPENALPETIAKYAAKMPGLPEKEILRAAIAENLDTGVGRLLAEIDSLGIASNTFVIYMSDNGAGGGGRSRVLAAGKGGLWEGGIRVPLIVRGPGVRAGAVCRTRIVGYDLLPTCCALAGVTQALPTGVEGGDWSGLLATGTGEVHRAREELVFHFPHYQGDTPHSAILLGDYKLMKWYEDGRARLFDLAHDLGERTDLSGRRPEKVADLEQRMDRYLREVEANMPFPDPNYDPTAPAPESRGGRRSKQAPR